MAQSKFQTTACQKPNNIDHLQILYFLSIEHHYIVLNTAKRIKLIISQAALENRFFVHRTC